MNQSNKYFFNFLFSVFLIHVSTRQLRTFIEKKHYHVGKKVADIGLLCHPDI